MIRSLVTELLLRNRASVIYPEIIFRALYRKNYALDRKMIGTLLMDSMFSITVQSLAKIEQARRADCRWDVVCMFFLGFFLHAWSAVAVCIRGVYRI